jgi:hypothetical protein
MYAQHEDTRARWEQYSPEEFIRGVMGLALRDKITLAYSLIHVYTGVIHKSPTTLGLRLSSTPFGAPKDITDARALFLHMRAAIADAQDVVRGDIRTLPTHYTPHDYILSVVKELNGYIASIRRWASALQTDVAVGSARLPQLHDKAMADVAADVLRHVNEIKYILDFAQMYAEKLKFCN